MRDQELFSVVILLYRNEEYIRCAIDSVLAQDYPAIELIIADDHSPEVDLPDIELYANSHKGPNIQRVLVYQNPENLGTVRNINRALEKAEGRYIKLLAADDALYDSAVLSNGRKALDGCPSGVLISQAMRCDASLQPIGLFRDEFARSLPHMTPRQVYRALCVKNRIVSVGEFYTREFFDRVGLFDERYRLLEDWPLWLRISREGISIGYWEFISVKYRSNVGSATSVNSVYLADKEKTFAYEIKPYWKELGPVLYLRAWLTLRIRNSVFLRKVYGLIFRR